MPMHIRNSNMTFKELNISEPILKALNEKNYTTPTPIQQQAIPVAIAGRDILGIAQTGTGKTAAFAIPIIEHLSTEIRNKSNIKGTKALILTPTRELAIQIEESFCDYAKHTDIKLTVLFGGVKQKAQVDSINRGTDIIIATPGRLLDLIGQRIVSLDKITHFVLDEADRMLDMGFVHDIKKVLQLLPKKRQNFLFSATMPNEIISFVKNILQNPLRVEITPVSSVVDTIEQRLYYVEKPMKIDLLFNLLNKQEDKSVLIFSRTKHGADKIAKVLNNNHFGCEAIHGNKSQNARQKALSNFKTGKTRIIVATDIAARGIDIQNLGIVINFDMPDVAETYVHRIGRTGRAGNSGMAFTFCSRDEHGIVKSIQQLTGKKLSSTPIPA